VDFQRLMPDPAAVALDELLDSLHLEQEGLAERPHVLANFVATVDGRAAIAGRSAAIGDEGDHAVFHGLRERVDAVLVGTGTLRAEGYGRLLRRRERREARVARGQSPEPLACLVTRSGDVPDDIPLFAEPEAPVIVFAPHDPGLQDRPARVEFVQLDPGTGMLAAALRWLRAEGGVGTLLCEGGPTLFASMLDEGVVDELFLTIAPKLAGGGQDLAITRGRALADPAELRLRWLLERAGSLFLRYAFDRQG
jgi:riboflavin biosynthesis pyrimidine reductase